MTQAIILAGGKGTRLRERLGDLPKPLVDICGRPLLERQIELLKLSGYSQVLILVNFGAEHIRDFCIEHGSWGLDIECVDDGEPRGTAGATLAVLDRLEEEFLVVYGDTMLDVDLQRLQAFHQARRGADATLFLHPNDHPQDSDLVELNEDGRVINFHPYPHAPNRFYPNLVNAALYYMRRSALEPWRDKPGLLDFGKDIFPAMLDRGCILFGYNSPEYIKDCGTPARLDKVCADLNSGRIARSSLKVKQAAVFLDRDGTINQEVSHLCRQDEFELLPGVAGAIKRLNSSEFRSIVITNQPVVARGDCTMAELHDIHNKMETLLGSEGAYLDRIYVCPHHPDRGYPGEVIDLKIDCDCRKPKSGLVKRAISELNINPRASWFVGDTSVDMLTARRLGLRSILVETGYAGLDGRYHVTPDFIVPDLAAAVSFILDGYSKIKLACQSLLKPVVKGDVIFLGGLSRSGKSNVASCLRQLLQEQGCKAVVLSVDRWLRNGADREEGVVGRYAVDTLREVIKHLCQSSTGIELPLPAYDKIARQKIDDAESLFIAPDDILIIEGTIALSLMADAVGRKNHGWFVEINESERKRRVMGEYRLRGCSSEEAEAIYDSREIDESPSIRESFSLASHRIVLGDKVEIFHNHTDLVLDR